MLHAFKQSKRGDSIGPWILIFLLVFVLFGASLWENWGDITDQILGGLGGNQSLAGLDIEVGYADGTTQTFDGAFSTIIPMTILDSGGEVRWVTLSLRMSPKITGDVSTWEVDATMSIRVGDPIAGNGQVKTETMHKSGKTLTSGIDQYIGSFTYLSEDLERFLKQIYSSPAEGQDYGITWTITDFELTTQWTTDEVTTHSLADTPFTRFVFNYDSGAGKIESLAVTLRTATTRT